MINDKVHRYIKGLLQLCLIHGAEKRDIFHLMDLYSQLHIGINDPIELTQVYARELPVVTTKKRKTKTKRKKK